MTGGAIKDQAHTGTSKRLSQDINRGPIRKILPNVYVTIQSHGLSAGARTDYVTANGVRNGLGIHTLEEGHSPRSTRGLPTNQGLHSGTESPEEQNGRGVLCGRVERGDEGEGRWGLVVGGGGG